MSTPENYCNVKSLFNSRKYSLHTAYAMSAFPNASETIFTERTDTDRDGSRLAYLTVEVGIACAGLMANLLVIATILSCKKLRSVNYQLILNLSFSDLGMVLFTFPFAVNMQEGGSWPKLVCLGFLPISDIFQGVSFWTITVIAISRYRILNGDFRIRKNTKRTTCLIACIWLVSFAVVTVPLIMIMKHIETPTGGICNVEFPEIEGYEKDFLKKIYTLVIRVALNYILPLFIITATYVMISIRITKANHQLVCMMNEQRLTERSILGIRIRSALKRNYHAKKLLTPLVLVFAVTVLPFNLLRVLQFFELNISYYQAKMVWIVCLVFLISHCAINPVIYCIVNPDFYQEMKQLLRKSPAGVQVLCSWLLTIFYQRTEDPMQLNSSPQPE